MYHSILRPGAQRQLRTIGEADLVIGLPTYKNIQTATRVARIALDGMQRYYPNLRTVLVNADAGHAASTRKAIQAQASGNGNGNHVVTGRYDGALGQGSATAALLDAALALDAKAIVILDSYADSITPAWIAALAHLILNNKAEVVFPRYRQWLLPESYLNDLIVYPLCRTLWGQSIRCPLASDFALSPRLARILLDEDVWGTAVSSFSLVPWLATFSVVNQRQVAQTAIGPKIWHDQPDPWLWLSSKSGASKFKAQFQDVLNVVFSTIFRYRHCWNHVNQIQSLPTLTQFAAQEEITLIPEPAVDQLLDNLALGWMEYRLLWQKILTPDNMVHIEALASLPADRFHFPSDLWARVIFDFGVVFNKGEFDPARIVDSLFPLYQGRLAAFWQEIDGLAPVGKEGTVAAQAVEFEEMRSYLKSRWRAYQP